MESTVIDRKQELLQKATLLQSQIQALEEKVRGFLQSAGGLQVTLPELHDEETGRIDAQRLANFMGIPLKRLADALDLNYKAVHRNPTSAAIQGALQPLKRALVILHDFFQKPELIRAWLNTAHPDFDGRTAMEVILDKKTTAVLTLLENAVAGIPV